MRKVISWNGHQPLQTIGYVMHITVHIRIPYQLVQDFVPDKDQSR